MKTQEKRQGRENKILKILPNNQIITACRIELRVQEMTINEKLAMIGLILRYHLRALKAEQRHFSFKTKL